MEHPVWYRQRRYLHFDEPLGFDKAAALVSDPAAVARHAFWPLISYEIETSKIKEDVATGELMSKDKIRNIAYAAHSDSHILSYYCSELAAKYELAISERRIGSAVLAFRSLGKNNIDFAKLAFEEISRQGDCTAIAFDITKFFDSLDHSLLKRRWRELLGASELPNDHYAVFKAIAKFSKVDRNALFLTLGISAHNPRNGGRRICEPADFRSKVRDANLINTNQEVFGIPQGTAISALLSNIYMLEFDSAALAFASEVGGAYMRYCDDMLFIVPTNASEDVQVFAETEIKKLKLDINPDKTDICDFVKVAGTNHLSTKRPLQYLGFLFDGRRILIRSAAFAKFSNRMKRAVSLAKKTMRSRNASRLASGGVERQLYLKKLYSRYSHLGGRNFLRYGYRAADVMGSKAIRGQLRPLWGRLQKIIGK